MNMERDIEMKKIAIVICVIMLSGCSFLKDAGPTIGVVASQISSLALTYLEVYNTLNERRYELTDRDYKVVQDINKIVRSKYDLEPITRKKRGTEDYTDLNNAVLQLTPILVDLAKSQKPKRMKR